MKLSVELEKWRADRPDEWKMDEFIRNAEKLESERDALAAQVDALRKSASDAYTQWNYSNDVYGAMQHLIKAVIATPQQHLRDVRAEAVLVAANSCLFMADINTDDGVVKREICLFEDLEQFAELAKAGEV